MEFCLVRPTTRTKSTNINTVELVIQYHGGMFFCLILIFYLIFFLNRGIKDNKLKRIIEKLMKEKRKGVSG